MNGSSICSCPPVEVLSCPCGIDPKAQLEWTFSDTKRTEQSSRLAQNNTQVLFHPGYSTGTSLVCGSQALARGRHHFWEFKLDRHVYGSSFMVGVVTESFDITANLRVHKDLIGMDNRSWGVSYTGDLRHNGWRRKQSHQMTWEQGGIVGLHLDLFRGQLTLFYNRVRIQTVFRSLNGTKEALYPAVSSSAGNSGLKLITARSWPADLFHESVRALGKLHHRQKLPALRLLPRRVVVDIVKQLDYLMAEDFQETDIVIVVNSDSENPPNLAPTRRRFGHFKQPAKPLQSLQQRPSRAKAMSESYKELEDDDDEDEEEDHVAAFLDPSSRPRKASSIGSQKSLGGRKKKQWRPRSHFMAESSSSSESEDDELFSLAKAASKGKKEISSAGVVRSSEKKKPTAVSGAKKRFRLKSAHI